MWDWTHSLAVCMHVAVIPSTKLLLESLGTMWLVLHYTWRYNNGHIIIKEALRGKGEKWEGREEERGDREGRLKMDLGLPILDPMATQAGLPTNECTLLTLALWWGLHVLLLDNELLVADVVIKSSSCLKLTKIKDFEKMHRRGNSWNLMLHNYTTWLCIKNHWRMHSNNC